MLPVAIAAILALSAPDYAATFEKGVTFAQFLDEAEQLKDEWQGNYDRAVVDDDTLARLETVRGAWRILVVAEDWCHDSVATVPPLARLVDASHGRLSMRIVHKDAGQDVMDAHKTPDGRAATPTIVVLDDTGAVRGAISERPAALWAYSKEHPERSSRRQWYVEDQGRHAMAEVLDMISR